MLAPKSHRVPLLSPATSNERPFTRGSRPLLPDDKLPSPHVKARMGQDTHQQDEREPPESSYTTASTATRASVYRDPVVQECIPHGEVTEPRQQPTKHLQPRKLVPAAWSLLSRRGTDPVAISHPGWRHGTRTRQSTKLPATLTWSSLVARPIRARQKLVCPCVKS